MFNNRPALNARYTTPDVPSTSNGNGTLPTAAGVMADAYHLRDRIQARLLSQSPGEVNLTH